MSITAQNVVYLDSGNVCYEQFQKNRKDNNAVNCAIENYNKLTEYYNNNLSRVPTYVIDRLNELKKRTTTTTNKPTPSKPTESQQTDIRIYQPTITNDNSDNSTKANQNRDGIQFVIDGDVNAPITINPPTTSEMTKLLLPNLVPKINNCKKTCFWVFESVSVVGAITIWCFYFDQKKYRDDPNININRHYYVTTTNVCLVSGIVTTISSIVLPTWYFSSSKKQTEANGRLMPYASPNESGILLTLNF